MGTSLTTATAGVRPSVPPRLSRPAPAAGQAQPPAPSGVRTAVPDAEAELVRRLQAGDESAFAELVRTYGPRMLAAARRFLPREADAADVLQDAFLSVFRGVGGFVGGSRLSTWLHRVTVNAALMRIRARSRRPEVQAEESLLFQSSRRPVAGSPPAVDALGRGEILDCVRKGLARLPEEIRAVVRLRDIEGMELREISGLLGVCCSTVKTRLHRGRMALRGLLEARFGGLE
jgi:RNA polymerase sigma-70 factor (ECF subfamily)